MRFKGIYQNKSSLNKVGILFSLMFLSSILHSLLAITLVLLFADNGMTLITTQDLNNQASVNYLKLMQFFSGVGLFITPMLLYAYLTNFDFRFLSLTRQNIILGIAIMILITPFVGFILQWNMKIPFPDWLSWFDMNTEVIIEAFLSMNNLWDLFYTLLVIAVVPAIGEELLFRGYLQQKLVKRLKNSNTAILITAFLFSAIHFDLQGMIPRFMLGLLLGYLFYWSGSLWLPILAHFVNNAQAIIFSYPSFKINGGAYSTPIDPLVALFSFFGTVLLIYILYQNLRIKKG